uniref:Uncharacterized protein n=1 Tax=Anopheles atroparvus TaxID=41427 RepID=A0A182J2E7_ANOAO
MNVHELLIQLLLAQQVIVARQAVIPTRPCRHKYRLQRVWKRGPFRYDSAQYEPASWEWDDRMLRNADREKLRTAQGELANVNQPKLLWKAEQRHEDYDSLMESDDALAIWPEPSLHDQSMGVARHDNVGSRFVKTPSTLGYAMEPHDLALIEISTPCEMETATEIITSDPGTLFALDYLLPETLPQLTPLDLAFDEDMAEFNGILSQILNSILSLLQSILDVIVQMFTWSPETTQPSGNFQN